MNLERLTQKSQEALQDAHARASEAGHPELTPEHLLLALLTQEEGIVPMRARIAERLGLPQVTLASVVESQGDQVRIKRDNEGSTEVIGATLPIVSQVEPREVGVLIRVGVHAGEAVEAWSGETLEPDGFVLVPFGTACNETSMRAASRTPSSYADGSRADLICIHVSQPGSTNNIDTPATFADANATPAGGAVVTVSATAAMMPATCVPCP